MSEPKPNVQRVLKLLDSMDVDRRSLAELGPGLARTRTRQIWADFWSAEAPKIESIVDHFVPTSEGTIPVRVYDPASDRTAPIIYFHGGGFVVGDLDTHDCITR